MANLFFLAVCLQQGNAAAELPFGLMEWNVPIRIAFDDSSYCVSGYYVEPLEEAGLKSCC